MEEFPKGGEVRNLGEFRREKLNAKNTSGIGDDSFIQMERGVGLTTDAALTIAREIKDSSSDAELLADFIEREVVHPRSYAEAEARGDAEREMREGLAQERKRMKDTSVNDLVHILDMNREHPGHYYKTMLLATAEALLERFPKS